MFTTFFMSDLVRFCPAPDTHKPLLIVCNLASLGQIFLSAATQLRIRFHVASCFIVGVLLNIQPHLGIFDIFDVFLLLPLPTFHSRLVNSDLYENIADDCPTPLTCIRFIATIIHTTRESYRRWSDYARLAGLHWMEYRDYLRTLQCRINTGIECGSIRTCPCIISPLASLGLLVPCSSPANDRSTALVLSIMNYPTSPPGISTIFYFG